ncbi:hypothetical protein CXB51_014735 [Gossypium anomalum]|uniref:Endonuclease/exonuclease/phosphatase domain-containing protein n=1 Tax=Gossypium anomalum TaxID=47600 RepID=A0A8J6D4G8_9ROSI|nr:hypothetical protein CXB51_014735 [Gossypium anomalum]
MEKELVNLNITNEEDLVETLGDEIASGEDYRFCLVGRVLMDNVIHFSSMSNVLEDQWHPSRRACIMEIGYVVECFVKEVTPTVSRSLREDCMDGNWIRMEVDGDKDKRNFGTRGGLSLVWKEGLTISLRSFSKSLNNMEVDKGDSKADWRFTGFYGSLMEHVRKELWNVLRQLKNSSRLPWLILGDFNEERQMLAFWELLKECGLSDLEGFKDHLKRCWEMNLSSRLSEVNGEELSEKVLVEITEVKLMLNLEANREELFWK